MRKLVLAAAVAYGDYCFSEPGGVRFRIALDGNKINVVAAGTGQWVGFGVPQSADFDKMAKGNFVIGTGSAIYERALSQDINTKPDTEVRYTVPGSSRISTTNGRIDMSFSRLLSPPGANAIDPNKQRFLWASGAVAGSGYAGIEYHATKRGSFVVDFKNGNCPSFVVNATTAATGNMSNPSTTTSTNMSTPTTTTTNMSNPTTTTTSMSTPTNTTTTSMTTAGTEGTATTTAAASTTMARGRLPKAKKAKACNGGKVSCTAAMQRTGMNCILNACVSKPACVGAKVLCTAILQRQGLNCILNSCVTLPSWFTAPMTGYTAGPGNMNANTNTMDMNTMNTMNTNNMNAMNTNNMNNNNMRGESSMENMEKGEGKMNGGKLGEKGENMMNPKLGGMGGNMMSTLMNMNTTNVVTIARFMPYPGTQYSITGSVIAKFVGTRVSLEYDLHNVDSKCTQTTAVPNSCGLHIHMGTTCSNDTEIGGHYFGLPFTAATDPWVNISYKSDNKGNANGVSATDFGANFNSTTGRAIVIHDQNGTRMACALIPEGGSKSMMGNMGMMPSASGTVVTVANFVPYPGTQFNVAGTVVMKFVNTSVSMDYHLQNTDAKCVRSVGVANSCGLHIHVGKTCTNATEIAGHYYDNSTFTVDPWLTTVYVSNNKGVANGAASVNFGYSFAMSAGRSVIVHDQNGTRMACAIIPSGQRM